MLTNQENKNVAIASLLIFSIFFTFYLSNYPNYKEFNLSAIKIFNFLPLKINLFFTNVILPTLIFFLLQKIFLKYINFLWATSISILSILSYANYDFKKFLFDLFLKTENIKLLTEKKIILLENINISFFLLFFLLIIFICLKINRFKNSQIFGITILWSLFSFYSLSGSIIGIVFWNIYSSIRVFRLKKSFLNTVITSFSNLIFYIMFIFYFKNFLSIEGYSVLNIYNFTINYFLFYFLGPVILIFLIYSIYKIDIYELFVKFMPIYVLMFTDLIVSIYLSLNTENFQNFEYFIYPHFILHFLYIIPILYYLTRPLSPFVENKKNKINTLKKYIFVFFNNMSKVYLSVMILFLILFLFLPGKI